MTRCLPIPAPPLGDSLTGHPAGRIGAKARAQGWDATRQDVYAEGFDPRPTPDGRAADHADPVATLDPEKRAPRARLTWRALHPAKAVPQAPLARLDLRLATDIARLNRRLT